MRGQREVILSALQGKESRPGFQILKGSQLSQTTESMVDCTGPDPVIFLENRAQEKRATSMVESHMPI